MFLFYSTVPIILKVDHYPPVSNSWLPCFLFQSSCSIISDMRRDYAEPLTPDLRHVGRSNPYLCLPWEGLCTPIPLASPSYNTTSFSQTCGYLCFLSNSYIIRCALNWTDESKLWVMQVDWMYFVAFAGTAIGLVIYSYKYCLFRLLLSMNIHKSS
jgi:hypothetical protein